jgi:hypothetical protein
MVDSTQTEAKEICHRCGTRWCTAHYSGEAISQAVRKATLTEVEKWMRDNRYRVGGTTYIDFAREFGWQ